MKYTVISFAPKTVLGYRKNGKPIYNIAGGSEDTGGYTGGEGQQGGSGNGNPAWGEFLEVVPQEFHEKVTPILQKWDQGVQDRFQKVHSDYEPWKPIIGAGVEPKTAEFALNLLNAVNEDPEMVWRAIGENYKLFDQLNQGNQNGSGSGQGQGEPEGNEDPYSPQIQELQRQQKLIAEVILGQRQAQMDAEADAVLDKTLKGLQSKYKDRGVFDEDYVLAKMQNGIEAEDAVKSYFDFIDRERQKFGVKPLIMGSGGGVPNSNTDVRKLDEAGRKNLVTQMLQANARQQDQ